MTEEPQPSPRPVRRDAFAHHTRTAIEYHLLVRNGVRNPGAWIAAAHDVAESTGRVWVLRARRAGFIEAEDETEGDP